MTYRILLVEDDTALTSRIAEFCKRHGHCVLCAGNGQEALDLLAQDSFDLVLMDVKMPVIDGIEATKRIRANPAIAHLPIVFITAMAFPQQQVELLALRPHAIFIKPFEYRALLDLIGQIVGGDRRFMSRCEERCR